MLARAWIHSTKDAYAEKHPMVSHGADNRIYNIAAICQLLSRNGGIVVDKSYLLHLSCVTWHAMHHTIGELASWPMTTKTSAAWAF